MAQAQPASTLLGTWQLVSYQARDSEGQIHCPLGEQVSGQLIYDSAGNMSAHAMRNDRPCFASKDPARGTDAEIRAAFEGHVSYFGTYTIDPQTQTVTHHVRGASFPNWVGSDQLRYYRFDGSRLLLSTPPLLEGGQSFEYLLIWERIQ
jgi:Lipocalin-like domain